MAFDDNRVQWLAAVLVLVLGAWAFLNSGDDGAQDSEPVAADSELASEEANAAEAENQLSFEDRVEALRVLAEKLQLSAPEDQIVELRRRFVDEARSLGDEAIVSKQTGSAAEIGRILMEGGEARFAEAFLQRCMGLLKPAETGKHHIYPLAQLRRADGRALEAASLYERAIDVEPTSEAEYVGLSDLYLAADRIGPARAAVSRGLRKHEGSTVLKVQGAKVALLDERAEEAMSSVSEVLAASPEVVAAQLVQIEAMLALGKLAEARALSTTLREEFPADAWGWVFGGAVAALQGDVSGAAELLDQAAELAGDCPCTHEERLAIAWVGKLKPADRVAPRSRAEAQKSRAKPPVAATPGPPETGSEPR